MINRTPEIAPAPRVEANVLETAPPRTFNNKLRVLGRQALAAGVSLVLLASAQTPGTALADSPTPYDGPAVGVATTGLGDDDGGSPNLYPDIAAEGMTEARLNVPVVADPRPGLAIVRPQIVQALANGIEPVINLQQDKNASPATYPQEAAQIAAALPRVDRFVIGNEWNSPYFSNVSTSQVVKILALSNQAIHAVRPDAITSGLALASGFDPVDFLETVDQIAQQYGGLEKIMDSLDVHLYRSLAMNLLMLQQYQEIWGGLMYVGEAGSIVRPGLSPDQAALDEIGLITAAEQNSQIQGIDFYRYANSPTDPFKTANVLADGTKLPGYYMLQALLTGQ